MEQNKEDVMEWVRLAVPFVSSLYASYANSLPAAGHI